MAALMKSTTIPEFHAARSAEDRAICDILRAAIDQALPDADSTLWHAHPVWFLDGNPVVGYSKLKDCIRLMFWSGADFEEAALKPGTGKFKDASIRYTNTASIDTDDLMRWLTKSRQIQWDYRDIVRRKGRLERLK